MENSENNTNNSSLCKICAQNGFPNIRIFWNSIGEKEDGTPKWAPHEDINCNLRHTHRQVETETHQAPVTGAQLHDTTEEESAPRSLPYEYLANIDVIAALTTVLELDQKRDRLMRELLAKIYYRSD